MEVAGDEVAGDPARTKPRRAELRALRRDHAAAGAAFVGCVRDVVWPEGTWLMRVRHGLACATGPPR